LPIFNLKYLETRETHVDLGAAILKPIQSSLKTCIGHDGWSTKTKRKYGLFNAPKLRLARFRNESLRAAGGPIRADRPGVH